MNTQGNMYLKGDASINRGNTVDYFEAMKNLIAVNDGTRSYTWKTVSCHHQSTPFSKDDSTYLPITDKSHHVSQISEGFIHAVVNYQFKLQGANLMPENIVDPERILRLFVGHKSSNQLLYQMWIYCNNNDVGYEQNQMIREGFAMSLVEDYPTKKHAKFIHSLWENVQDYNENVCGKYIPLADILQKPDQEYAIEYIIPFDDICVFQAFDQYPNSIVGDITLKFYVRETGLVWALVDPTAVYNQKANLQNEDLETVMPKNIKFSHFFTQIGLPALIPTVFKPITEGEGENQKVTGTECTSSDCTLICTKMEVARLESNMKGFQVCDSALKQIREIFKKPVCIPAQELTYHTWATSPDDEQYGATLNVAVYNASTFVVAFPRNNAQITCLTKPIVENLYLKVDSKQFPDKTCSTESPQFFADSIRALDLDGMHTTQEFNDSFTMRQNRDDAKGTPFTNTLRDNTCFVWPVNLERMGAGYVFDGIDSGGQTYPIELGFTPMYKSVSNTYIHHQYGSTTPPPQLWIIRDTYFDMDATRGLKYHKYGCPPGSQIEDFSLYSQYIEQPAPVPRHQLYDLSSMGNMRSWNNPDHDYQDMPDFPSAPSQQQTGGRGRIPYV